MKNVRKYNPKVVSNQTSLKEFYTALILGQIFLFLPVPKSGKYA